MLVPISYDLVKVRIIQENKKKGRQSAPPWREQPLKKVSELKIKLKFL